MTRTEKSLTGIVGPSRTDKSRRTSSRLAAAVGGFTLLAFLSPAHAATYSANASGNATVQGGGPRSGSNGITYFNIEGEGDGSFASFGVADFSAASFNIGNNSVTGVNSLSLDLYDAPASFSANGMCCLNS